MSLRQKNRSGYLPVLLVASALSGPLTLAEEARATPGDAVQGAGMQGGGTSGKGMYGKGMHGKGKHAGRQGRRCDLAGKHGHKGCGKHNGAHAWKRALSPEQRARIDQLHVNFAKTKAPLKAKIKALKVDLAVLAATPQPDKAVIDSKIEELLKLKGQMLGAKYGYIAAQRQILTPRQQVSFDMDVVQDALHGKKGEGTHGCRH